MADVVGPRSKSGNVASSCGLLLVHDINMAPAEASWEVSDCIDALADVA